MPSEAKIQRTQVNLSGLMRVLGEHLYSTPHVAVRELVQNAHDSIRRREIEGDIGPFSIQLAADPGAGTLSIEDDGAGLTREEIDSFLATVGSGTTRLLRDRDAAGTRDLIGYFGLGFLTAHVVSDATDVWTCSRSAPNEAWLFSTRGGETYSVRAAPERPVGTRVTLKLADPYRHLADVATLEALLERYCCLLGCSVSVDGRAPVNVVPPWRMQEVSELRRRRDELDFARRFERAFEPLCAIPFSFHDGATRGLLWIQDGATYGTSDNRNISVFVRGMFVSHEERELLPRWAGFTGAVLESDELMPTASRESLQHDVTYRRIVTELEQALIEGLARLPAREPAAWRRILLRHNEALLGAGLCDVRLFDLLKNDVTLPTSEGDLTLPAILKRTSGKLYVSQEDQRGYEDLLFAALKQPVVRGTRYAALPFAKRYADTVRGSFVLVGGSENQDSLFRPVTLPPADRDKLTSWFGLPDVEVVPARFEPEYLPFVLVPDRQAELKRRVEADDIDKRASHAALGLARLFTKPIDDSALGKLYVNAACPAIEALLRAPDGRANEGLKLLRPLLGLLSGGASAVEGVDFGDSLRGFTTTLEQLLVREDA